MRRLSAILGALTATAALVAGAGGTGRPAGAGADPGPVPGTVSLVEQAAWVALGGRTDLVVSVEDAPTSAELVVTVHEAITSNTSFQRTLDREDLGSTLGQVAVAARELEATPTGRRVPILLDPATPAGFGFPAVGREGVYPLVLELRDPGTGDTGDAFVTYLVVVDTEREDGPIGERLRVAWVWPFVEPPAELPDGAPDPDVIAALRRRGRLGQLASALPAADTVPITIAPGPETLEAWARWAGVPRAGGTVPEQDTEQGTEADTVPELPPAQASALAPGLVALQRAAADGQQVLTNPFVPIDFPSLLAAGLEPEAQGELVTGTFELGGILGTRIDPRTEFLDPVDDATVSLLASAVVDRLVLEPSSLTPRESRFTPARPFVLAAGDATVAATANNALATSLLETDLAPALQAQQFLAALAVVALEEPNAVRGLVVVPPSDWDPDPETVSAATTGLDDHPFLEPVDLDTYFDEIPPQADEAGETVVRTLEPPEPPDPPVTATAWRSADDDLEALATLVSESDPRIARGERSLLVSLSATFTGDAGRAEAEAHLAAIDEAVQSVLALVSAAEDRTVTITARRAEIPITFRNDADEPIRVKVSLESDKLSFPNGSEFLLELPPRSTTEQFLVEARTSGTFPLTLTVSSPDGRLDFQRSRLTVRSTAVSGVGVLLTVAAASFLALWWLNHFVQGRRRRRARSA